MITLKILSAGAVKRGVATIASDFERETGAKVTVEFTPVPLLKKRVAAGDGADVLVATPAAMDEFAAQGRIDAATRGAVGRSRMGIVVHADAPMPSIVDTAAFQRAVLAASHVVYNEASSGIYVAKLLDRLGLAQQLGTRAVVVKGGADVMEFVAAHPPAALGVGQMSEAMVLIDKGCRVKLAGPVPDEIQNVTRYEAAACTTGAARGEAAVLARRLASPEAKRIFAATGID